MVVPKPFVYAGAVMLLVVPAMAALGDDPTEAARAAAPPVIPGYDDLSRGRLLLDTADALDDPTATLAALLDEAGVLGDGWSLTTLETRNSPLGSHHRYRFTALDLPLLGHSTAIHEDPTGRAWFATQSLLRPLPPAPSPGASDALIGRDAAVERALERYPGDAVDARLGWNLGRTHVSAAWQIDIIQGGAHGDHDMRVIVDAESGDIVDARDRLVHFATGSALVFDPSPTVSAQNYDLPDVPGGGPAPWLESERFPVMLQGLVDSGPNNGRLVGQFSTVNGVAQSPTYEFSYSRTQLEFQEVMVYFHTDRLQRFVQSLGFFDVNNESQLTTSANDPGPLPNAYYSPSTDSTRFISHAWVTANADAAEDAEVVLHENGHAFHYDQVPDWGANWDQGSMGEGFSDYLAAAVLADHSGGFGDACTGEWFGSHLRGIWAPPTGPPCIRYLDNTYTYSQLGGAGVHTAGQIWSGFLWDIWHQYTRDLSLELVLASHFLMDSSFEMPEAADMVILADRALHGGAHEAYIAQRAHAREISGPLALWILGLPGGDPDPYGEPGGQDPGLPVNYTVDTIAALTVNTTGWTAVSLGDESITSIDIPATPFYGENVTEMHIASNGFVAFGEYNGSTGCCSGGPIPEDDDVNGIVAPFWTDLRGDICGSRVSYTSAGDWIEVAFEDMVYYPTNCGSFFLPVVGPLFPGEPARATFWMRISPHNGTIEIHLLAADGGTMATSGIEAPDGSVGNETRRTSSALTEPVAWRFTPHAVAVPEPGPDPDPDPEPEPQPYATVHHYAGRIGYAAAWRAEVPTVGCVTADTPVYTVKSCGGVRSSSTAFGEVGIPISDDVKTIVVELAWTPSVPTNTRLQLDTFCPEVPRAPSGAVLDPDHPCYFVERGESVLRIRVDAEHWAEHGYDPLGNWAARVFGDHGLLGTYDLLGIDAGIALEQPFALYVSVFHIDPAPEEYTAIP